MPTSRNKHPFVKALNQLLLTEDYEKIVRLTRCRNWMDYSTLQEIQKCKILHWLLSPTEGHGLGDYFIQQLLRAVYQAIEPERIKKLGYWSAEEALMTSFSNALVTTELRVEAGKNKEGRIDLLIYDDFSKTLIVIERKDGSSLSKNQLEKYQKWCEVHYPDTTKYYLLLDSFEKKHDASDSWVQLNDDWLIQGMQNLLGRDQLPLYIEQQFKDLLNYVFADWQDGYDPAYAERHNQLLRFMHQHQDAVDDLRKAEILIDKQPQRLVDLDYNYILGRVFTGLEKCDGSDRSALLLYMKHYEFVAQLLSLSLFEKLEVELSAAYPNLEFEHFKNGLYLTHKRHVPNAEQAKENSEWPYNLTLELVERLESEQDEDSQAKETLVIVSIHIEKTAHPDLLPLAEQMRAKYEVQPHHANKTVSKLKGRKFLNLDEPGGLKKHIHHFYSLAQSISTNI